MNEEDADSHDGACYQDECHVSHLFLKVSIKQLYSPSYKLFDNNRKNPADIYTFVQN